MTCALDQAELQENIRLEMKLLAMLRTHGREGRARSLDEIRLYAETAQLAPLYVFAQTLAQHRGLSLGM